MRYLMTLILALVLSLPTMTIPAMTHTAHAGTLTLSSSDIAEGVFLKDEQLLNGFGCTGGNVSPALRWSGLPKGTKSLALTMYDPEAPTGSGWWHWVVFNIPATEEGLAKGVGSGKGLPQGAVQSRTDFGAPGYGGGCPPQGHGMHRYIFTIHALDVDKLDLPADSSAALVGFMLGAHTLEKASITAVYAR